VYLEVKMISVVTQQRDAKLDIAEYYKNMEGSGFFSICFYDPVNKTVKRLGVYSSAERRNKVFLEMVQAEEIQNRGSFFIYYMPEK